MKDYLKQYSVVLETVGPVFVGSGKEISKKEYIRQGKDKVVIPDMHKLYAVVKRKGKSSEFEEYMMSDSRMDLSGWLKNQQIMGDEIKQSYRYELDCGDALLERGTLQIFECIKDPYGQPFVPGTSLKGMFRTILLCDDIMENPDKYISQKEAMEREVFSYDDSRKIQRNSFLKKKIMDVEAAAYRTLNREESDPKDAVNDIMQGFIVSDSEPLKVENLVLCQKVERHTDGTEKRLNLLRECIKPGTDICFTITVDTSVCQYDDEKIRAAIKNVITNYYNRFQKCFGGMGTPKTNYLYLGGGSGYVSKTVVYSLYKQNQDRGVAFVQSVFDKTGVSRKHGHNKDRQFGVSPHIIKCTRYKGDTLQMGLCRLKKIMIDENHG